MTCHVLQTSCNWLWHDGDVSYAHAYLRGLSTDIAYNLSMLAKSYLHRLIVAFSAKDG